MKNPHPTRERDEELLRQIKARQLGVSSHTIAQAAGVNPGIVFNATNSVRNADIAESGEDVTGAYW